MWFRQIYHVGEKTLAKPAILGFFEYIESCRFYHLIKGHCKHFGRVQKDQKSHIAKQV